MEKLIIAKSGVAYAGTNAVPGTREGAFTPDLLAPGSLGIYGFHRFDDNIERFALISHYAATSHATPGAYIVKDIDYSGREIVFYLGAQAAIYRDPNSLPTTQPKQSSAIQLRGIRRLTGAPYVPAVLQSLTITFPALPATTTNFDEYILIVSPAANTRSVFTFTFDVVGKMADLAALSTAFVAQITARDAVTPLPFTAVISGSTVVITAKKYTEALNIASDGLSYPVVVTGQGTLENGQGNFYQVYNKESNTLGEQGQLDQIDRRVVPIARLADPAGKYDTYLIDFVNILDNRDETDDTFSNQEQLTVFIPQGSVQANQFEDMFNLFSTRGLLGTVPVFNNTAGTIDGTTTTTTAH